LVRSGGGGFGGRVGGRGGCSSRIGTIGWVKEEERTEKKNDLWKPTKTTMTNVSYQWLNSSSYDFLLSRSELWLQQHQFSFNSCVIIRVQYNRRYILNLIYAFKDQ
jgi:hypothetical protein